ncbi:hypothetical protein [Streptomyces hiroshimensis]|uniref:Helix-turn-helix domain-containing protein n=1 Tax=Streptomyces hiroshimensis TaxID=66424 RepID=A0ABQ2Y4M4_9ACTN|nr:hypothetical protein [Streptomyces hiroshimensis]GGX63311.1 hypothetical protein GCM10010324_05080 [Streptomyces hiroshimensis]
MSPTPPPIICDTVAAAQYVSVTPSAVRQWIRRGHVERRGYDHAGRALVDLREVRTYLTDRKHSTA